MFTKMKMNKKGQSAFDALNNLVIPLVVIGLVLGIGLLIMSEMKLKQDDTGGCCANGTQLYNKSMGVCCKLSCNGTHCDSGAALTNKNVSTANCSANAFNSELTSGCNGTSAVQTAMNDIPGWLAIFVIVIIGGVLLALISMFRRQ